MIRRTKHNTSHHVLDLGDSPEPKKRQKEETLSHREKTWYANLANKRTSGNSPMNFVRPEDTRFARPGTKQKRDKDIQWVYPDGSTKKRVRKQPAKMNFATQSGSETEHFELDRTPQKRENLIDLQRNLQGLSWFQKLKLGLRRPSRPRAEEPAGMSFSAMSLSGDMLRSQIVWFLIGALAIIGPVKAFTFYTDTKQSKDDIIEFSYAGIEELKGAQDRLEQFDLAGAGMSFLTAKEQFRQAEYTLESMGALVGGIASLTKQGDTGEKLIQVGEDIAQAGHYLTQALDIISHEAFLSDGILSGDSSLTAQLAVLENAFTLADIHLTRVESTLASIDITAIPEENHEDFVGFTEKLPLVTSMVRGGQLLSAFFLDILGADKPKRYLFVFQNNAELRPSGGFMGSLAIIDVHQGNITGLEIPGGGPYDYQGSLTANVISPEPLRLVNAVWQFQDANWWPDWPTSAEKIMWFYEHAGGSTVDGVWSMTPDVLEEMLALTGEIDVPEHGVAISADNFRQETQEIVELRYDKSENRPKQFIADLAPKVLDTLFDLPQDKLFDMMQVLQRSLSQKDILMYFSDQALQAQAQNFGWTGDVKTSKRDYLLVAEANIAGGKTDRVISREIDHHVTIASDGRTSVRVLLTRTHHGDPESLFEGATNNSYVRFYVPAGSKLISANGFSTPAPEHFKQPPEGFAEDEDLKRIEGDLKYSEQVDMWLSNEFGKTVFGGWQKIAPGETKMLEIEYLLPWDTAKTAQDIVEKKMHQAGLLDNTGVYSVLFQKQPGVHNVRLSSSVTWPEGWQLEWSSGGENTTVGDTGLKFRSDLATDRSYGVLLTN